MIWNMTLSIIVLSTCRAAMRATNRSAKAPPGSKPALIETDIPARLERLPWGRFCGSAPLGGRILEIDRRDLVPPELLELCGAEAVDVLFSEVFHADLRCLCLSRFELDL